MIALRERLIDGRTTHPRTSSIIVVLGLLAVVSLVTVVIALQLLPMAVLGVIAVYFTIVSIRWPLVPLAVFVALIPIEQVVLIEGFGTASKLVGIVFAGAYGVPRLGRLVFGVASPMAWGFLVWAMLSVGWAVQPAASWGQLPTLLELFVTGVLVADIVIERPGIVRPIMWIYSVSAAVTALIGIQTFASAGALADRTAALPDQNPAQFAGILLPALVYGFYQLIEGERRFIAAGIVLLTSAGVVISGTRGAWVGVAVVIFLFVLPRFSAGRRVVAIAAMLVFGVLVYQLPGVAGLLADRTETAISSGGAGRTDIWTVALTIYESHPVLGVGYANFPVAYTPDAIREAGVTSYPGQAVGRGPHNLVIGTLVELGPVGLLLLVLFLGPLVVRRGWGPDGSTIQAALTSILVLSIFLDVFSNRKQVWLMIGIAAGLAYLARRPAADPPPLDPVPTATHSASGVRRLHTPPVPGT